MNNKSEMKYFKDDDILHFVVSDEKEAGSIEITPNITAEINGDGELIGIEILNASSFVRDYIMEMAQAKILGLAERQFAKGVTA
ncbi:DNA polymerase III subunit alpha [Candidatus Desulfarcum epimagneticum]|uniref:DNA polymerase III subunit alpha n=1 Tax=uncultured Desulfobacteraceae bacterium TaxID=218296 RepID=A0A484HIN3_9BACT|nr:DNA polymerase III subunit alpha [uncultured Desulfobacteraceae bacterium]